MEKVQKIIAASGLMSRRSAEKCISQGRVTINGLLANIGDRADAVLDVILVDGIPIAAPCNYTYIMLNKPKGIVTTMKDEKERPCVAELVSDIPARVYPVGRLDMYSEGLLLMTDDGELANHLMHPSHEVKKTYHVTLKGSVPEQKLALLSSAMIIDGYRIHPADIRLLRRDPFATEIYITIHEGRNRQIRKMVEQIGERLVGLKRIAEHGLQLGDLSCGSWRYLTDEEIALLKNGGGA